MHYENWRVFRALSLVGGVALSGVAAHAETPVTYTDVGRALFKIEVPDFWNVRTGGIRNLADPETDEQRTVSRLMGLTPVAEEGIWMGLIVPAGVRNTSEGLSYLQDVGPFLVEDAEVSSRATRRIGGRTATTLSGQGRREGRNVAFTAAVIPLPGNRVAVAVVVMESGLDAALVEDVNAVFASFRPL